jgi:hypothetical protein
VFTGGSLSVSEGSSTQRRLARLLHACSLLVILCFIARTSADADLWGHLTFGRDIVRTGGVHTSDPYSFTSDIAWINHEWLAEVCMWLAWAAGGTTGLVTLKLLLAMTAGGSLLYVWRPLALPGRWKDALLFAVTLGVWPQLATLRPQVFSIALFAALLALLIRVHQGRLVPLLTLPVLVAVWVNTHGGWLVGAGVLALFTACAMVDARFSARRRTLLLAAGMASAAATLVNPYGVRMLAFLTDTVRPERADIVEWSAVTALPAVAIVLWSIPATVGGAALWCNARRIPLWHIVVTLGLAVGALRVARLIGFFMLAVAFLLVPYLSGGTGERAAPSRPEPRPLKDWTSLAAQAAALACVAVLLCGRVWVFGPWTPEPEAVRYLNEHRLSGRMVTWFDYGEYAIWHLTPAIRVSMDGRRETVYSERLRALHTKIYRGGPDGIAALATLDADYVWLPNTFSALQDLAAAGWHPAFIGARSTILARQKPALVMIAAVTPEQARAFPGP